MAATPDNYSELLTAQISHSSSFSTATISSTATTSSANTLITISDQPLSLEGLVTLLADQKGPFLDEVEAKVFAHVSKTGRRELISIVEKDGYGDGRDRTHHPGLDSYVQVFGCFVIKEPFHHHSLDSALSEPVAGIVSECYANFISERQVEIAEHFLKKIVEDEVLRQTILGYVAEELLKKGVKAGRNKIIATLSHSLTAHAAHTHIGLAIQHGVLVATHHVAGVISSTAGTAAGTLLAAMIIKAILTHMGITMAEVLHGQALHGLAAILSHKVGMAACAGVAVSFLANHIGTAGAALIAHALVAPLAVTAIGITLYRLPKSLGKKVAKGVKAELAGEFRAMTETILDGLAKDILSMEALGNAIVSEIVGLENWQSIFAGSVNTSAFPTLNADMAADVQSLNDVRHCILEKRDTVKSNPVDLGPCPLCSMSMAGKDEKVRKSHILDCLQNGQRT